VTTLVVQVSGCRARQDAPVEYWVSDGTGEGTAGKNGVVCRPLPHPALEPLPADAKQRSSNVFGPSYDRPDVVARGVMLPELRVGDFLAIDSAGCHPLAGAAGVGAVDRVPVFYAFSEEC